MLAMAADECRLDRHGESHRDERREIDDLDGNRSEEPPGAIAGLAGSAMCRAERRLVVIRPLVARGTVSASLRSGSAP